MRLPSYVPSLSDIRALLGVSVDELEDETICLLVYERNLEESLIDIDEDIIDDYQAVVATATASRTKEQRRFFNAFQTYATYHVADDLTGALPQFSPKVIGDSKAQMQRHANDPYLLTTEAVKRGLALASARLKSAYAVLNGGSAAERTTVPVIVASTPSADPVTGA